MMDLVNNLQIGTSYVFNLRRPGQSDINTHLLRTYCGHFLSGEKQGHVVVLKDSLGYYRHIAINDILHVVDYGS